MVGLRTHFRNFSASALVPSNSVKVKLILKAFLKVLKEEFSPPPLEKFGNWAEEFLQGDTFF